MIDLNKNNPEREKNMSIKKIVGLVIAGIISLLLLIIIFDSAYTVDEGERGIILRNGKAIGVAEPGLNFKAPIVDRIKTISVRSYTAKYDKLQAYSKDQQPADLRVSVTYRVPPTEVVDLYSTYSTVEGITDRSINRQVPTQVENVFGQYTAISAVQNRAKLVADLGVAVKNSITGPIFIESIQIENIDFSKAYEKSVEDRMKAEVDVQTQNQNWEKEKVSANIEVTKAEAAAKVKIAGAEADAKSIKLRGEAEAEAIKARAAALAQNENLVELTKAERWNGVLPTTMLPNTAMPYFEVNKK